MTTDNCKSSIMANKYPEAKEKLKGVKVVSLLGILFSTFILSQVNFQSLVSALVLLIIGIPIYVYFSPKKELSLLKKEFFSRQSVLARAFGHSEVFFGHLIKSILHVVRYLKKKENVWLVTMEEESKRLEGKFKKNSPPKQA